MHCVLQKIYIFLTKKNIKKITLSQLKRHNGDLNKKVYLRCFNITYVGG